MKVTFSEVIVLLIAGGPAGSSAGAALAHKKEGFGRYVNPGGGAVEALIVRFAFDLFNIQAERIGKLTGGYLRDRLQELRK
jgi:hypothetical protein